MALTDFNIVVHPQSGTSYSTSPTVVANRAAITASIQNYNDTIKDRYNQVQGKSASDLAAMGITLVDGTYFKNGVAWLTANNIEAIEGKKPAATTPTNTNDNNPGSLASNLTDTSIAKPLPSFFSKYGVWLIGGAIVLISGILLLIPKKKS